MDLVSFETQQEYEWVKQKLGGKYNYIKLSP